VGLPDETPTAFPSKLKLHQQGKIVKASSSMFVLLLPVLLSASRRELTPSPSCQGCCESDNAGAWAEYIAVQAEHVPEECSAAFEGTAPGMCCGPHPSTKGLGCCPIGGSCVQCGETWRCTHDRVVTRQSRCSVCAEDKPPECNVFNVAWWQELWISPQDMWALEWGLETLLWFCLLSMCLGGGGWMWRRRRGIIYVQGHQAGAQSVAAKVAVAAPVVGTPSVGRPVQGPVQGVASSKAMM
jgi:hypothetical protein